MDTVIIAWLLVICLALYVIIKRQQSAQQPSDFPVQGKVIYADQGKKSRAFVSQRHKIRAKPDFLMQQNDGTLVLLEYKSRQKPPYQSDVAQLIATAIAVKEKYPNLSEGLVYTRGGQRRVNLTGTTDELAARISEPLEAARSVKTGSYVCATPVVRKCRFCGYRTECSDRAV